jgi:hypothetical protein
MTGKPLARECPPSDALACCARTRERATLSLCRLLAEMIDLRRLTRLPDPPYTSHMASSFDRRSEHTHPGDPDWYANRDFATLKEGAALVLLDAPGPGVVTRIWSANPSGILRIYLDGADRPALEAPMRELLRGEWQPIAAPFAFEAAHGGNLYLPIAYRRRCLITLTSDAPKLYYQVSYRSYAAGVQLEPFDLAAFADANGSVRQLARRLEGPYFTASRSRVSFELDGRGRNSQRLAADPGGSVLRELRVQLADARQTAAEGGELPEPLQRLRRSVLEIWADGERTVRAPLGDFFGTGPGLQAVNALAFGVDAERGELVARWPMPFARELRIALSAGDGAAIPAHFEVQREAQPFDPDSLLFYAQWHPAQWHTSEPTHEFTLAELHGDGIYVGTLLNVTNSLPSWWGEGDEKIWIDQEAFPSFFGTGTEDYFGYAYCSNEPFSQSYVGQTLAGQRANFGRISLYRIHIADPIRFTRQLRFDLEVNHWAKSESPVGFDSISYFYARPGALATPSAADSAFRIPSLDVPEPDVPAAPYRCGG